MSEQEIRFPTIHNNNEEDDDSKKKKAKEEEQEDDKDEKEKEKDEKDSKKDNTPYSKEDEKEAEEETKKGFKHFVAKRIARSVVLRAIFGRYAILIKLIPVFVLLLVFVGLLIFGAIMGSTTGDAATIADLSDVDYYFSEEFDGDFSKLDDKNLKDLFEKFKEAKDELTSEGKSFDHIMVMATIDAIKEFDTKDKIQYKDFSKRDIKKIGKAVSGKSDDEIKVAIADRIAPKYIKLKNFPVEEMEIDEEESVQQRKQNTTSKGYTIENRNGVYYINNIPIVNKTYNISPSYNPGGLTKEFSDAFEIMKADAKKEGITLKLHSDFRSYEDQVNTYNYWVSQKGKAGADDVSSRPGHSEHQLGLTADINNVKTSFKDEPAGKWLNANMYKYGFILRYPNGKKSYTGYDYEPWHIRYVGKEFAKTIYNNGNWISLEEYFGIPSDYNIKPSDDISSEDSTSSTDTSTSTNTETTPTVEAKNKDTPYYKIAEYAIELRDKYYEYMGKANECITSGSCNYKISGFSWGGSGKQNSLNVNNLKVRLMQSSRTGGKVGKQLQGSELVDFEKYVLGVAYAEIGCPTNENYFKTQLVAARSFALSRPSSMNNSSGLKLSEENGQWILQIRSSVDDQQYCDPDLGCSYDPCGKNIERCQMWAGTTHGKVYKGPLSQDSDCRKWASETIGEVLVDSNGYIINTGYKSAEQKKFSTSTNYKSTLISHYSNANTINKADCNAGGESLCAYGVSTGDFANWTQKCDECRNVPLGNSSVTIYSAGCLATSVAMLIAKSDADTSKIVKEYGAFNHVTFVKALNKVGGFVHGNLQYGPISKVVPNFQYVDKNDSFDAQYPTAEAKAKHLQDLINQGYYVALQVKCKSQGTHFVALDAVQNGHVYIMDPATNSRELWTSNSSWKNQHCTRAYVRFRKT